MPVLASFEDCILFPAAGVNWNKHPDIRGRTHLVQPMNNTYKLYKVVQFVLSAHPEAGASFGDSIWSSRGPS